MLSAVSLVLCVATIALWIRGWRVDDLLWMQHQHPGQADHRLYWVNLESGEGTLGLNWDTLIASRPLAENMSRSRWRFGLQRGQPLNTMQRWRLDQPSLFNAAGFSRHFGKLLICRFKYSAGFNNGMGVMVVRAVMVPDWFSFLLTSLSPSIWIFSWRKRLQRIEESHCLSCGYDLRATPELCPECGYSHAGSGIG